MKYPQQEDILEWAKPALPLEETFDDLFLEDLMWAHVVSLHQQLDTPQFKFTAPLVSLLQRGLQDKEQVGRLTPEAEFVVRYAVTVGGRNLELVHVCLSKVGWPAWCSSHLADYPLAGLGECLKGCPGVEGGISVSALVARLTKNRRLNNLRMRFATSRRLIPCLLLVWGRKRILSLSTMRFHSGLLALHVQRSLMLVPCEQDSIVCHMVKDWACHRAKTVMCCGGGLRSRGGR